MAQSATSTEFRHLDGCMNSSDAVPCFVAPGNACRAVHTLGDFGTVNDAPTEVVLVRTLDTQAGSDTYIALFFRETGEELALSLALRQSAALAFLLHGALSLHELYRADDAALHAQVTK